MATPKLAPCPFCGSNETCIDQDDNRRTRYMVICKTCKGRTGFNYTKAEARAAWNRRAGEEK